MSPWTALRTLLGYGIPMRALMLFFDTLAVQLEAGRPIGEALLNGSGCSGDGELQRICAVAAPMVQRGASLNAVFRPHAGRFPEIVMPVLEVGELAGALPDAARRLGGAFGQSVSVERRMILNAYDPRLTLLGLCMIQAIFLIAGHLGAWEKNQPLPIIAISVAEQLALFVVEIVTAYMAARLIFRGLYRWHALRVWADKIKLALPMFGPISRNLSVARWARSFAVLWSAGVNVATGLEVSARSSLNAYYERALNAAAAQTRLGWPLSQTLAATELLPPYLLSIVRTSETVGRMDDQLLSLADEMEREALMRTELAMNKIVQAAQLLIFVIAIAHSAL